MSDVDTIITSAKGDIESAALLSVPLWLKPFAGTGLGMPSQVETAKNAWVDIKSIYADARHRAETVDGNDGLNDIGRARELGAIGKDLAPRLDAVGQRLKNVTIERVNIEIYLEKNGKPHLDPADQRAVTVWGELKDMSQLELYTLWLDYIEQETKGDNNAAWIGAAIEGMVDIRTGKPKLSGAQLSEGRRIRGERRDPDRARLLRTLREAESHLSSAYASLSRHVNESFVVPAEVRVPKPKRDRIAEMAFGS